jgi:hypothetical protein
MQGAAVLQDPQPSRRRLLDDAVVEHDHAVRDVLLDSISGQRSLAAFAGDDRGNAALLEPTQQPTQFGTHDRGVGERSVEVLQRVEHHSFGAHLVDRRAEAYEQRLEIPLAGLGDIGGHDVHVVEHEHAVGLKLRQVETERGDVGREVLGALFERDEDSRLAVADDPADQELHREQRLSAAGRPADEGGATARQPAARDLVEAGDTGRRFGELGQRAWGSGSARHRNG